MTYELLLARRLLEAVADPDAPQAAAEEAVAELVEANARHGVMPGRTIPIPTFEGMRPQDLSPAAWLYLLENRISEEPEIPVDILEAIYLEYGDAVVRFRLVSCALSQPQTRARYAEALDEQPEPDSIAKLPDSWPKRRVETLQSLATRPAAEDRGDVEQALQEFVLYLLQDGSAAALALAAGAVAPDEEWRRPAREMARAIVLRADPELADYGRAFRRARLRD
ncbi:MAG: hypothetical protein ABW003_16010 [Microvirga sp.]